MFLTSREMIAEQPIFGWQPIEFWRELGNRLGKRGPLDAHNTFLHLLLEVGLVGAIPFLVGICLCGLAAWRARRMTLGLLPLSLFLTTLAANMALTGMAQKPFWLVLALAMATVPTVYRERGKRSGAPLIGRALPQ